MFFLFMISIAKCECLRSNIISCNRGLNNFEIIYSNQNVCYKKLNLYYAYCHANRLIRKDRYLINK